MAAPAPILCMEKERLIRAYTDAALEYNHLNSIRIAALIRGEETPPVGQISEAEMRKENSKYAILAHMLDHGC
jgi:hypothetical protein